MKLAKRSLISLLLGVFACFASTAVVFASIKEFHLVLENHVFIPSEITIPADQKVKIVIENKDSTAEEFDSFDLNREKVIFAKRKATIFVGPLPAGRYEFFGEFHPNSARGYVIVEAKNP